MNEPDPGLEQERDFLDVLTDDCPVCREALTCPMPQGEQAYSDVENAIFAVFEEHPDHG